MVSKMEHLNFSTAKYSSELNFELCKEIGGHQMTNENIKNKVLEYIKNHNATSFVEIEQVFEAHHFDYKGDGAYTSGVHQNVIFWTGWNEQAFNVVAELKRDGYIELEPCPLFIYLTDGKCLSLPVMQKVSDAKHDCWLPITFSTPKVA